MSYIYKNLLSKNSLFQQPAAKIGTRFADFSETMYLCNQLGGEKMLHIHNQSEKNSMIYFFEIFVFYARIFKRKYFIF